LDQVHELRDADDLSRFKRLALRQRYAARLIAILAVAAVVIAGAFIYLGLMDQDGLRLVLLFGVPFALLGIWLKRIEARVKELPASDPALRNERDLILQTWFSSVRKRLQK
jgi:hypothetical protein